MPDREKVKAELDEIVEQCRGMDYIGFSTITEHCQNILALLKEQPEIVRCKDCEFYEEMGHFCKYDGLYKKNSWHQFGIVCHEDWFCADGERKEGR